MRKTGVQPTLIHLVITCELKFLFIINYDYLCNNNNNFLMYVKLHILITNITHQDPHYEWVDYCCSNRCSDLIHLKSV